MIVIDLDTLEVLNSPTVRSPLTRITRKQHDYPREVVIFLRNGVQCELAEGATGILGLKEPGKFSDDFLASALSWSKEGSGVTTRYVFDLNLNTEGMNGKFTSDAVTEFLSIAEVTWTENGRPLTIPGDLEYLVRRDYIQGGEGPGEAEEPWGTPDNFMFRNPVEDVPTDFDDAGNQGDYVFDPATFRLWFHTGTQWVYSTVISS